MKDIPDSLDKWLQSVGIDSKLMRRVRFGGVVGKLAIVCVAVMLVIAAISRQTSDVRILALCVCAAVLVGFAAIAAISFHGHKHPLEATLEGGEIVAWAHVQQEYAVKGLKEVPASPLVLEGLGSKPLSAASAEDPQSPNSATKGESV